MNRGRDGFRRHTSSVLWLGLAEASVRGGNVVLQFLVARALGRDQYGIFAYALSLAMVVVAAGGIGLLEAFVRRGAAAPGGIVPALSEFFPLRAASAAVTFALLVAVSLAHRASAAILAVGLFVLFRSLTAFLASSFRAAEVMWKEFALRCGETAVLLGIVLGASHFRPGLVPMAVLLAGASALFLILTVGIFRTLFPSLEWRWPGAWISAAFRAAPLGLPALIGSFLLRTDVILIQRTTGNASATADYAAAVNLVLGAGLIPATVSAALFPALSRRKAATPPGMLIAAGAGFLLLGAALWLALAAWSGQIVRLAYGAEFESAGAIVAALSPFVLFLAPTIFAATVLASRNAAVALVGLALFPLGLKIFVDLWLLPAGLGRVPASSILVQAVTLLGTLLAVTLSARRSNSLQVTDNEVNI